MDILSEQGLAALAAASLEADPGSLGAADHVAFEETWSVYQRVIDAYQAEKPATGRKLMTDLIKSIHAGVPNGLPEVRILGRTMQLRRDDIVAHFDHPGASVLITRAMAKIASATPPETPHPDESTHRGPTLVCEEPSILSQHLSTIQFPIGEFNHRTVVLLQELDEDSTF